MFKAKKYTIGLFISNVIFNSDITGQVAHTIDLYVKTGLRTYYGFETETLVFSQTDSKTIIKTLIRCLVLKI